MRRNGIRPRRLRKALASCLGLLVSAGSGPLHAEPPPAMVPQEQVQAAWSPGPAESVPEVWTRAAAIDWALRNNPDLMAVRQQHGIAAAAVVIAKTYPYNPVWTNKLFGVNGPESAGVDNHLAMEQRVSVAVEIRHQGRYRLQAACAALTRADWDIVNQETLLAMRVVRAFDAAVYQHDRLRLAEESLQLQREVVNQVRKLTEAGVQRGPDNLILAQSEVNTYTIALNTARSAQVRAESDLRAALGLTNQPVQVEGALTATAAEEDSQTLVSAAFERRPDLQSAQAALQEAEGRLRLAVADRFGNPTLGPDFEYNETRAYFIGAELTVPLPVFNTRRGEICQREAERNRAALMVRSTQVAIEQQVYAALSRLSRARETVEIYRTRVLPELQTALQNMEQLFSQSATDLLKVIDVRRRLIQARSGYLDALYELRQARLDLAAAVADPTLALDPAPGLPQS